MPTKQIILLVIAILIFFSAVALISYFFTAPNNSIINNAVSENSTLPKKTTSEWRAATDLSRAEFKNLENQENYSLNNKKIIFSSGSITNPTTGDQQNIHLYFPENKTNLPLVVLIPGGANSGTEFEKPKGSNTNTDAIRLATADFVVVVYSPLGIGESAGKINYQGFDDQDGLAAIIAAGKKLDNVDSENIGLASFSYGITGATGVLARYPDLNIKFFSDWEGPSNRLFTSVGCNYKGQPLSEPRPGAFSCQDEEHWLEREAVNFIKKAHVKYYWRIQQETNHVQNPVSGNTLGHTLEIIQTAVGNVPWVKLNDGEVNAKYATETDLPLIENDRDYFGVFVIPHLKEMSKMQ